MLGWMDDEALHRTLTTGRGTYWSRSRQEYWVKGETSGHTQRVVEVRLDCDGDTVLLTVDQTGPACHTGAHTCFDADVLLADGRAMAEAPSGAVPSAPSSCSAWPPPAWPRSPAPSRGSARSRAAGGSDASMTALDAGTRYPLASAISLVLLAAWGVLLVTRGAVRRAFACSPPWPPSVCWSRVVAALRHPARHRPRLLRRADGPRSAEHRVHRLVLDDRGLLRAGAGPGGARRTPGRAWPEMGSRYDAPGAREPTTEASTHPERDLWQALDEGRDPTDTEPVLADRRPPAAAPLHWRRRAPRRPTRGAPCPTTTATPPQPGRPSSSALAGFVVGGIGLMVGSMADVLGRRGARPGRADRPAVHVEDGLRQRRH